MEGLKQIQVESVDIRESEILSASPELLNILLSDHTTNHNIFWATKDYESNGSGYDYKDEITPEKITGDKDTLIMPCVLKETQLQQARIRDKAEVFTPSWICNAQNNLVDNAWFDEENVFNKEAVENGVHFWSVNPEKITFPKGKTWEAYVKSTRLVCARKITQDAYALTYRFVPLQDLSKPWTDAELYEKYDLSQDEIKFIEATIKPLD